MVDPVDERIVAALRRDGRADLGAVAAAADASVRTVRDRLEALESGGAVGGYVARVNYGRLGYVTAVLRLEVGRDATGDVTARLRERPAFVTVYETTGRFSVFAIGLFEDETVLADRVRALHADPDVDGVRVARVESVLRERRCPLADG